MTTLSGETTETGLLRVDRFEWERWIRRYQLAAELKLLAFTMATYASVKGADVRPGDDRLARVLGCSDRTVRRNRQRLVDLGLLERTTRAPRRGMADEYVLTIPADLLDTADLLDPDERPR